MHFGRSLSMCSFSFIFGMNYLKRSLIQCYPKNVVESREWMLHMLLFDGVCIHLVVAVVAIVRLLKETFIFNMVCCIFGGVPRFIRNQLLLLHVVYERSFCKTFPFVQFRFCSAWLIDCVLKILSKPNKYHKLTFIEHDARFKLQKFIPKTNAVMRRANHINDS